jgi:hypothetical protein
MWTSTRGDLYHAGNEDLLVLLAEMQKRRDGGF